MVASLVFGPYATVMAGILSKNDESQRMSMIIGTFQWILMWLIGIGYGWAIYSCYRIYTNSK